MRRIAVLGASAIGELSAEDADEVIVLDPSPTELLGVLQRLQNPSYSFLLGELPVLPLPDNWVDVIVGADDGDAELTRVRR